MESPDGNKGSDEEESVLNLTKRGSPERKAAREAEKKRKQQQQQNTGGGKKKKKKRNERSPATGTKSSSSKVKVKKEVQKKVARRKRFTQEEDQFLCGAFVNASHDERRGADQRGEIFWKKTHKKCTELYGSEAECAVVGAPRTWDQLQTRFCRQIQKNINTFNPCFKSVKEKKPSGVPYHEHIDLASEECEQMEGGKFKFKHCVEMLHQCPKFNPVIDADDEEEEEDDATQTNSPKTPSTPYNKIGRAMGDAMERPKGSKKAKKEARTLAAITGVGSVAATIESTKINSVNNLAASAREPSTALENEERHDGWLRLAAVHEKMGNVDKALEHVNMADEDMQRMETAKKKAADASPATATTNGTSPPVRTVNVEKGKEQENVSVASSGAQRRDQESCETPEEQEDNMRNGSGSGEDDEDDDDDSSDRNENDANKNESPTTRSENDEDSAEASHRRHKEARNLRKLAGENQAGV